MNTERVGNGDTEATLIKVRYGNDIRKVSLHHNEDISYDDLCLTMQRIFKIKSSTNITLKYRDDDDDLITIADDNDLLLALRTERNLSLVILSECSDRTTIEKLASELELIRHTTATAIESLKMIRTASLEPSVFGVGGNERPDTPAHKETVATIQPSVHEQVSNSIAGVTHPPAPSVHNEKPAMEVPASQHNIVTEFEHPPLSGYCDNVLQPPREEISNEPTTEIDISDKNQSAFAPVAVKQECNELDSHALPEFGNASAPPLQPQMPSAPVPGMPFSSVSQQFTSSAYTTSVPSQTQQFIPPTFTPAVPTQNSFTPPPTQFGYRPPQMQSQYSTSQYSAPTPPMQQIAPQLQSAPAVAPAPGMVSAPLTTSAQMTPPVMAPPVSMPTLSSQPVSMGGPVQGIPSYPSSQPSSTPTMLNQPQPGQGIPPSHQMSYSSSSTPVPSPYMQYVKQESQNIPQYPSFSDNMGVQQQQTFGAMTQSSMPPTSMPPASLPPSSLPPISAPSSNPTLSMAPPPTGAPPMMPMTGAPGINPFTRGPQAAHYLRPSFMPSGFQQQ